MYSLCFGCMKPKQNHPICEICGFDEQSQNGNHQLPMGTMVGGQYILGRVLGQGGFGITYLGWDRVMDRRVAVKEYFPSGYAGRNTRNPLYVTSYDNHSAHDFEDNKKRFLREAQSLAKLWDVPQIVKVLHYFEDNGTAYIAMEFVEGSDLRKFLKGMKRPLTMQETMQILGPVIKALSQVHAVGLVHRDISPDNIMVLPDGSAKLLDFGAARYVENANAEADRNTSTQSILKHGFAPPEQYRTHGALGPWSDIYAMCATIYYCLTGRVPPEAMGRTMEGEQIDWNIPGLNSSQKAALAKGMEILPKNRFASMDELLDALGIQLPAPEAKQTRQEPQKERHAQLETPKKKSRKKKKLWILPVLALLLVLLAGAAYGFVRTLPAEEITYSYVENETGITITDISGWDIPSELEIPGKINGNRVTAIGRNAFEDCKDIKQITFPVGLLHIEAYAFSGCRKLTHITIPNTVKTIGEHAFQGCSSLTYAGVPSSVNTLGSYAFQDCTSLTQISIARGLQSIGSGVFQNCTSLTEVVIPEGVPYINKNLFYGCTNLRTVVLPAGIRSIAEEAFYNCSRLQDITIPAEVKNIGNSAFSGCTALDWATIAPDCRLSADSFPAGCTIQYYP